MTLLGSILRKVKSTESLSGRYHSPPPELLELPTKKKYEFPYAHISARVDTRPPGWRTRGLRVRLEHCKQNTNKLTRENIHLLWYIKKMYMQGGLVDCFWRKPPANFDRFYCENRVGTLKRISKENRVLYDRLVNTGSRLATCAEHRRAWKKNVDEMLLACRMPFVLFDPAPKEVIDEPAFIPPPGVKRPRVILFLRLRGGAALGKLVVELFTDWCPETCQLFEELLDGDTGYGYVGTSFYRKVPGLYWSGGDVVYDNGFGCYAQRGRVVPIPAENYHFSHSMAGLVTMHVTRCNEVCGVFSITFKPLPQWDLKSVVFGRIVRPSPVLEAIQSIGAPLSPRPVVEVAGCRRRVARQWVKGKRNTNLVTLGKPRRRP